MDCWAAVPVRKEISMLEQNPVKKDLPHPRGMITCNRVRNWSWNFPVAGGMAGRNSNFD
jgi:hypothetical protein